MMSASSKVFVLFVFVCLFALEPEFKFLEDKVCTSYFHLFLLIPATVLYMQISMYLLKKEKDRWLESEEIAPQMKTENEMRPEKEE